jgi:hypothetical protein
MVTEGSNVLACPIASDFWESILDYRLEFQLLGERRIGRRWPTATPRFALIVLLTRLDCDNVASN